MLQFIKSLLSKRRRSQSELVEFVHQAFPEMLGDRLRSLIVYGVNLDESDATDSSTEPVRFLVVVHELDLDAFTKLAESIRRVGIAPQLALIIMSFEELIGSSDVFPITFLEMKRRYRVLEGEDILSKLEISQIHLRLRCEQELKNLMLRMQAMYLLRSTRARDLLESLRISRLQFLRVLRAALLLVGSEVSGTEDEIISQAQDVLSVDQSAMRSVFELCDSKVNLGTSAVADSYWALLLEVQRAAAVVDALPECVEVLATIED